MPLRNIFQQYGVKECGKIVLCDSSCLYGFGITAIAHIIIGEHGGFGKLFLTRRMNVDVIPAHSFIEAERVHISAKTTTCVYNIPEELLMSCCQKAIPY